MEAAEAKTDVDDEGGLLAIGLGDGDVSEADEPQKTEEERTGQTEEQFQQIKRTYRARIENGEIWRQVKLPLSASPTKLEALRILNAVEELYFFKRYDEAVSFVTNVLSTQNIGGLDEETREVLESYKQKCLKKLSPAP